MKTKLLGALLVVALPMTSACGAVLNLSYEAAYRYGDSCNYSEQGGVRSRLEAPMGYCWLSLALPIEAGRTIKQITVFYGTDGAGPSSIAAYIGYKELRAASFNDSFNYVPLAQWESTDNVADESVASANLMAQNGVPPLVSYPEAFVVLANRAYHVRVTLAQSSEFFGLKVLYD